MYIAKIICTAFFLLDVCVVETPCDETHAENPLPFGHDRAVVQGSGSPGPYSLGARFVGGTVTVERTSAPDSLQIASWDTAAGTITFNAILAAGDSAVVLYAVPPTWLRQTYTRESTMTIPRSPENQSSSSAYTKPTPKAFPGLNFGGSKTFEVSTGSDRAVALNQSLRLNISGNITDDITLNAAISDQNMPITPEGDTRELNELDRVLIELKGRHFRADMGDTDLQRNAGRWQSYTRRLSGAYLNVHNGGVSAFGSGAVSEGRYMSTAISPVEGNQGPYRLIGGDGNSHIAIIPGTERVWINGEQLTRGYNYDYTIDYSTGEITFSERRIIGSDMRIVCDYEYTSETYRRTFFSGGADSELMKGRLKIAVTAAREADDSGRPVYGDLDDASKKILAAAGDSLAAVPGIRHADGDSTGTYDSVEGHLVFNPLGKGAYNATFSWVGENSGSYRYRGGGIYEFVPPEERGPGSGASYEPITVISGPAEHSLAGVTVSFDPVSAVHFETELAGSSLDNNTLSSIDDSDNNGGAYRLSAKLSPEIRARLPLRLDIAGTTRSQERTFTPLDRDRTAEENRRWGMPLITGAAKETVTEFSGGMSVSKGKLSGTGILLSGGKADFGDSTASSRFGGESSVAIEGRGKARLAADHIVREHFTGLPDETIDRYYGETDAAVSGFSPSAQYEGERTEGRGDYSHGTAYDDIRLKLGNPVLYGVRSTAEWLYRTERTRHTSWSDSSTVRGGSFEISAGNEVSSSLRARYARRERTDSAQRSASDQALLEGYLRPTGGKTFFEYSYRAGRSREASRRKNFIYTGGGRGSYRWEDDNGDGVRDPEEFIPDEHGSYYLYEETLDDYKPVNSVQLFGRLGADLPTGRLIKIGGAGLTVRSETSFEVKEKSTASAGDVFLLRLDRFREKGRTTSGESRVQEDLTVPLYDGGGSLRLRVFRLDSYNAEFVSGAERKMNEEQSIRLRMPLSGQTDTEITLSRSLWNRIMEQTSGGNFRVRSLSGDTGVSYYPQRATTVGVTVMAGYDREDITGVTARFYSLKPVFTYRFSGRGKVETSYMLTSVTLGNTVPGFRIPYTMARGRKEGDNHDVSVMYDYRVSNRINIVATYTGRKFAGSSFENFAQVQMRTLF
ncbi:hypothetical protein LLG96_06525 [bacterium]|nr:hypothetical protein [bacterium]